MYRISNKILQSTPKFTFFRIYRRKLICFNQIPVYDRNAKLELENYWIKELSNIKSKEKTNQTKMYILSMFPYPSGNLHMGHMRVYTVADVLARYNTLINKNVIFPMGWDSFGLPAENAAFEMGYEPKIWIKKNIQEMKYQMKTNMILSIDWNKEISTSDPSYFKWTQWLFCRLFEKGLAYQRSEMVNWDPVDRTVLADELIDNDGRSWRSGAIVEKIPLKQWFIRTTALSASLLNGLETIKNGQWRHVIDAQRGWIGNLEGVYIEYDIADKRFLQNKSVDRLSVFTTHSATALSDLVAFVEINADNIWWSDYHQTKSSPSIHPFIAVKHPLSGRLIPVVRNKNLKFKEEECLSARLGIPLINFADAKLAASLNIPFSPIQIGAYNYIRGSAWSQSEGFQLDSNFELVLREKSWETLQKLNRGGYLCSKLRTDWLISRQRYWGTPIPIIHCSNCGPVLVPDNQLPVELPHYSDCNSTSSTTDEISSPLAKASDWVTVNCPKCGNVNAKRETDTMDTFVDSSWYFLRYLDPNNLKEMCSSSVAHQQMPVDIYVGGIEHAIRHLFYSRFMAHFIHFYTDVKLPNGPEPFAQFLPIGLVLGKTYKTETGRFVTNDQVKYLNNVPVKIDSEEVLTEYWDKMSKSKNNGVSPQLIVEKYGIDLTRLILMSNTGPDKNRKWQENDIIVGTLAWEKRLWNLIKSITDISIEDVEEFRKDDFLLKDDEFIKSYQNISNSTLLHYNSTFTLSVIIANLHKITSMMLKYSRCPQSHHSILFHRVILNILIYLYPLSPLLASELWAHFSRHLIPVESIFVETDSIYRTLLEPWSYDMSLPVANQRLHEEFSQSCVNDLKSGVLRKR